MSLMYGVRPVFAELPKAAEQLMGISDNLLMERGWAEPGDPIVVVRGWPMGVAGTTNTVQVHYVADVCRI
jgi:pyruvate kinase